MDKKELAKMILYAVALAMAIAAIVLSQLGRPSMADMGSILGIGLLALTLSGLISVDTESF